MGIYKRAPLLEQRIAAETQPRQRRALVQKFIDLSVGTPFENRAKELNRQYPVDIDGSNR